MAEPHLDDEQYRELFKFRTAPRKFLRWSDEQAASTGLTAQQHQLLLAIRGHEGASGPTIGEVADHLLLKHHSVVELVDRVEHSGFAQRSIDGGGSPPAGLGAACSDRRAAVTRSRRSSVLRLIIDRAWPDVNAPVLIDTRHRLSSSPPRGNIS